MNFALSLEFIVEHAFSNSKDIKFKPNDKIRVRIQVQTNRS